MADRSTTIEAFFDEGTKTLELRRLGPRDTARRRSSIPWLDFDIRSGRVGHDLGGPDPGLPRPSTASRSSGSSKPMRTPTTFRQRPICAGETAGKLPSVPTSPRFRGYSRRSSISSPTSSRWQPVRPCSTKASVSRSVAGGRGRCTCPAIRRPIWPTNRQCSVRRRHAVHARRRHGARRFPRRRRAPLYRSIRRLLALPPETRLFMCHDYKPPGRDVRLETTVAEQRAHNVHIHDGVSEDEFVAMRPARCHTRHADASFAVDAGQHPGRRASRRPMRMACATCAFRSRAPRCSVRPRRRITLRTAPGAARAAGSSAPCPSRCAAARPTTNSAWAP